MKKILVLAFMFSALTVCHRADADIVVGAGNIVVYRVGDGSAALTNASTAVFLDEFNGTTGALVQSFAFDTSGANRLTAAGTATSEGKLKYYNGFLAVTGYNVDAGRDNTFFGGTGGIANSTSANVNRSVAVINTTTGATVFTRLTDNSYTANNIRGAISDGNNIWMAGHASGNANNGVRHTTVGASNSIQLSTTVTNVRTVNIFDGQLYSSHNSGSTARVATVGTGLPTTAGQTMSGLSGLPTTNSEFYDFHLMDLNNSIAGMDTMLAVVGNNLVKYSFDGNTWASNGSLALGDAGFGLTGYRIGGSNRIFVSTGGSIRSYELTSGWNQTLAANQLWQTNAGTNTAFRGVAVPEPSALLLVGSVLGAGLLRRRRS